MTTNSIQLLLFDNPDLRPKPIQAAERYQFSLQRYEPSQTNPEYLYSVQDWIRGVAQTDEPRKFWSALKRRLKTADIQLSTPCKQLPYVAADGKSYRMDFATGEVLYQITQRMEAQTGIRDEILAFLAAAGAWVDKELADPEGAAEFHASRARKLRAGELDKLTRAGYGEAPEVRLLRARHNGIDAFNQLKSTIAQVCTEKPQYWNILNAEYLDLLGHVASELTEILQAKNVRDALSELQLSYLQTAEVSLRGVISNKHLTNTEIIAYTHRICYRLGESLADVSESMGIDRVTGQPMLQQGGAS